MTPSANTESGYDAILAAPGFALGIRCEGEDWLSGIDFLPPQPGVAARTPLAAAAVRQLAAYMQNPDTIFGLPLKPAGTPFQRRVWAQISAIPRGATRSYGQIASALHNAPRAVGQACGANPYPLIVPCHRVVAANGGLGGFDRHGGGFLLDIKRWLLAHEAG